MKFSKATLVVLIICLAVYLLPKLYAFLIILNGMSPNPIIKRPLTAEQKLMREGLAEMSANPSSAKADFTKIIELNPKAADAYFLRGRIYAREKEYGRALADMSKTIEIQLKHFAAYEDRAKIYFYYADYDKAWNDVYRAKSLKWDVDPRFLKKLKEASGRDK